MCASATTSTTIPAARRPDPPVGHPPLKAASSAGPQPRTWPPSHDGVGGDGFRGPHVEDESPSARLDLLSDRPPGRRPLPLAALETVVNLLEAADEDDLADLIDP